MKVQIIAHALITVLNINNTVFLLERQFQLLYTYTDLKGGSE